MKTQNNQQLQDRFLDDLALSPIQKYIKYKEFPWAVIMTLCLVFVSTLFIQAEVLGRKVQERNIQIFFNYHLLEHDSFDIYEGDDVFTYRTAQYMDFQDMVKLFQRTLQVASNLNSYNFYETNQTHTDTIHHSVTRYFEKGSPQKIGMTLQQMNKNLCENLKEYIQNVRKMEIVLRLNNLTFNVRNLDLIIQVQVLQRFQIKVTLNANCHNQTFTQQNRRSDGNSSNLQIRKVPSRHHEKYSPYNVGYFFRLVIIMFSFQAGFKRIMVYKHHPFKIRDISQGQNWEKLPLLNKCKIMGYWQITIILLNIIGLTGKGLAVFTAWVQLVRYLEYTENPYIITLLTKNILRLLGIVILTVFFVITGFVLLSMVLFTFTNKFESTERAYFSYIFNNFQYGIYQNFIAIERYGGFFQALYFIFCFYMVWCTNNIVPSILCNTVINKNRLKQITKFFKGIRIPCPVCYHITNEDAERAVKRTYGLLSFFGSKTNQNQVQMKIQSPKILPFFSPKLLPASRTKRWERPEQQVEKPKRTIFEIKEDLNMKLNISSTQLFRQKIQLLRKKIDQSLLEIDVFSERRFNNVVREKLIGFSERVKIMKVKVQKHAKVSETKQKKSGSLKRINTYEASEKKSE